MLRKDQLTLRRLTSFRMIVILLLLFVGFSSCRKDQEEKNPDNEAMYSIMKEWYYWYDKIPSVDPSVFPTPADLLEAIRYRPQDRWSYVADFNEFMAFFQDSRFIGYGFGSAWDADGNLRVSFTFSQTDIHQQGVRRSWIIESINGIKIQPGMNINAMLGANTVGVSNTFGLIRPDGTSVNLTLQKKEVQMNNVLHTQIFERDEKRIGYLVLYGFTLPTASELEQAFDIFSTNNIDELILDLRYNGGGSTEVARILSGLIGGNRLKGKTFVTYEYNDKKSSHNSSVAFSESGFALDISRLIVIATRVTASASEMTINGLKPFMPVVVIGDRTYGKPMGMNIMGVPDNIAPRYALVPITFKTKNADGDGDFFDGIPANISVSDDLTRMFGDQEESMLAEALGFIETGVIAKAAAPLTLPYVQPREQMQGLRAMIGAH